MKNTTKNIIIRVAIATFLFILSAVLLRNTILYMICYKGFNDPKIIESIVLGFVFTVVLIGFGFISIFWNKINLEERFSNLVDKIADLFERD